MLKICEDIQTIQIYRIVQFKDQKKKQLKKLLKIETDPS